MWLLLEIGNSRLKWAVRQGHDYAGRGALVHADAGFDAALHAVLAGLPVPERVLLASVADASLTERVCGAVRAAFRRDPVRLVARTRQQGVSNAYAEPAQMGVDRWLALIAAHRRWHAPVCVVDAGTAVTVDVLNADGVHQGGLIAPGQELWRSLLQARTAGIRADASAPVAALGCSTSECVANAGLVAVIGIIRFACEQPGADGGVLVVTGGGAEALVPHLPPGAVMAPDLVFDGMVLAAGDVPP